MGGSKAELEAEWNRRRRADKDGLPLPAEFRLFDDGESFTVRFPVHLPPLLSPLSPRWIPFAFFLLWGASVAGLSALLGELRPSTFVLGGVASGAVILLPFLLVRRLVSVRPEGVEIGWWPVPFLARRMVHRAISQAFVLRRGGGAVEARPPPVRGLGWLDYLVGSPDIAAAPAFDLLVLRPDGSREVLVRSLRSAEHAFFLERWLERRLGIEDAPVPGEAW